LPGTSSEPKSETLTSWPRAVSAIWYEPTGMATLTVSGRAAGAATGSAAGRRPAPGAWPEAGVTAMHAAATSVDKSRSALRGLFPGAMKCCIPFFPFSWVPGFLGSPATRLTGHQVFREVK
jgi:hypothetical protein